MNHTKWLKMKKDEVARATQNEHKPWAVYHYHNHKPHEVARYVIRADAENHKSMLCRFLPNSRFVVVFEEPEPMNPEKPWEYATVWELLHKIETRTNRVKALLVEYEAANDRADTLLSSWLAKMQSHLDEVGKELGDSGDA
jgi:hypothetical protein